MAHCYDFAWSPSEFFANGTIKQDLVEKVRKWAESESIVPNCLTDAQIVAFLLTKDCQLELTYQRILDYYTLRKKVPEIFSNRDAKRPELVQQLSGLSFATTPRNTQDGYAGCFSRIRNPNSSAYDFEAAMKIYIMQIDGLIHQRSVKGIHFFYDMTNTGMGHTLKVRLGIIKNVFKYVEQCMPTLIVSIHLVNATTVIDVSMELIKKIMSGKTIQTLHIYRTNSDLSEFFEKFIPKELVPSDYGGELPTLEEMHQDFCKSLEALTPVFEAEEKQRADV